MKTNLTKLTLAIVAVLIMFVPAGLTTPAQAQGADEYTGLDVVFLIDQSGSMLSLIHI